MRKKILTIIALLVLLAVIIWLLFAAPHGLRKPPHDPNANGMAYATVPFIS